MALFDFSKFKAWQAGATPTKLPPLTPPAAMPQTIPDFSAEFAQYKYGGPAIMACPDPDKKNAVMRGLGCRMTQTRNSDDGAASARIEALFTLKDLKTGRHPEYKEIAEKLDSYYKTKVYSVPATSSAASGLPAARKNNHASLKDISSAIAQSPIQPQPAPQPRPRQQEIAAPKHNPFSLFDQNNTV